MSASNDQRRACASSVAATLRACVGGRVIGAKVIEMGLYGPEGAPHFTHPDLNFVQAQTLEVKLDDGHALSFSTMQDDDHFALNVARVEGEQIPSPLSNSALTLFRERMAPEFPLGEFELVELTTDDLGNVQEIALRIAGRSVYLRAGEVSEDLDGKLTVFDRDESVLIFFDHQSYVDTVFNAPVYQAI